MKQDRTKTKKTDLIIQTVPIRTELLTITQMAFLKQGALKDIANSKLKMEVILKAPQIS